MMVQSSVIILQTSRVRSDIVRLSIARSTESIDWVESTPSWLSETPVEGLPPPGDHRLRVGRQGTLEIEASPPIDARARQEEPASNPTLHYSEGEP